jgi:hypothetical protein
MQSFGAGTSERNYWVLTNGFSSSEILVHLNNGTAIRYQNSVYVSYWDPLNNNTFNTLSFAYSPGGGYAASFSGADDPLNATFWPPDSTYLIQLQYFFAGANNDLWLISDTVRAELTIYNENITTDDGSMILIGDAIYDKTYEATPIITTAGMISLYATDAWITTPRNPTMRWFYVSSTNELSVYSSNELEISGTSVTSRLTGVVDANQPATTGKYIAGKIPLWENHKIYGWLTTDHARFAGRTVSDTYKTKRGDNTNFKLYHLFQDYWTPWDDNLAIP